MKGHNFMRPISTYEAYGLAYDQYYGYSLTLSFRFPKLNPADLDRALYQLYLGTGLLQCVFNFKKQIVKLEKRPYEVQHISAIGLQTWQSQMQQLHAQSFDYENKALFSVRHIMTPYFSDVIFKFHHAFVDGKSSLILVDQLTELLSGVSKFSIPSIPCSLNNSRWGNSNNFFRDFAPKDHEITGFHLQVFDVRQTRVITDFCKKSRISLHSFLAQSIVNGINVASEVRTSVDLRPYLSSASKLGNYQSYVSIRSEPKKDIVAGAQHIRKNIKQALSDKQHLDNINKISPANFQRSYNHNYQNDATVSLSTLGNFKSDRSQILGAMTSFNRAYLNQIKVVNCIINGQLRLAYQTEFGSMLANNAIIYLEKIVSNQQKGVELCQTKHEMNMKSLAF